MDGCKSDLKSLGGFRSKTGVILCDYLLLQTLSFSRFTLAIDRIDRIVFRLLKD